MSARSRTLSRLKYLSAVSMTSIAAASCEGYGVVDPLPSPSCNNNPLPTVSARYATSKDGGADARADAALPDAADDAPSDGGTSEDTGIDAAGPPLYDGGGDGGGGRLVELTLGFDRQTRSSFGGAVSSDATIVDSTFYGAGARLLVAVPAGQGTAQLTLEAHCEGLVTRLVIDLTLGETDVTATARVR
jgi:hypothetical protein